MDFTLKTYIQLIETIQKQEYSFQTFEEFISAPAKRSVVLRHDVDRLPGNALKIAELEERSGVRGSYYFRAVPESFDEEIIKKIAGMGHEIGYHYENLAEVGKRLGARGKRSEKRSSYHPSPLTSNQQIYPDAIADFKKNLNRFRKICSIKTICMHGSPLSEYDSRDLWERYDYRDYGIIGEPYFDVDFNKVFYLTDTGRRWDGEKVNIRDRISSQYSAFSLQQREKSEARQGEFAVAKRRQPGLSTKPSPREMKFSLKYKKNFTGRTNSNDQNSNDKNKRQEKKNLSPLTPHPSEYSFHSTYDIIYALEKNLLPDQIMINTHPQRWTDDLLPWMKELVWQNMKNLVKRFYTSRARH